VLIYPLHGVESEIDRAEIDEDAFIRRLSDEERDWLRWIYHAEESLPLSRIESIVQTWTHVAGCPYGDDFNAASTKLLHLVSAFRLLRAGHVALTGVNWTRSEEGGWGFGTTHAIPLRKELIYELRQTDLPALGTLLEKVASNDERSFLFALRRFELTYERERDDERLIDLWIALEGLFVPDGPGHLTYKASMRIARFLGDATLRPVLVRSYGRRSDIVHGRAVSDIRAITDQTESILRSAFQAWLDNTPPLTPKAMAERLDDMMLWI
jgi:hypothetical protein